MGQRFARSFAIPFAAAERSSGNPRVLASGSPGDSESVPQPGARWGSPCRDGFGGWQQPLSQGNPRLAAPTERDRWERAADGDVRSQDQTPTDDGQARRSPLYWLVIAARLVLAARSYRAFERSLMRKILLVVALGVSLVLGSVAVLAGGDQNQGETGLGSTVLGGAAQGAAEQPRSGR